MRKLIALLIFFSFPSFAYYKLPTGDTVYLTQQAAANAYISSLGGDECKIVSGYYTTYQLDRITASGFTMFRTTWLDDECKAYNSSRSSSIALTVLQACPDGSAPNYTTEQCDKPQEDWCQGSEYTDLMAQERESCASRYPNHFTEFTPQCVDKDNYSFDCEQGFPKPVEPDNPKDPTEPITPPDGNFGGGSSGNANPDAPDFDKPEPDSPTPESNTDTAVMEAIRNLNRDNNAALKGINTDVNKGFTDINNQLTELNGTNKALGQSVVDQMNQDYQIYQGNKQLMLQQTGTIAGVTKAVNSQTGVLKGSIDGLGSNIDGLGTKLDHIKEIIGDTAPCDPNSDDRSCEGSHGLGTSTVSTISNQIDDSVNGSFDTVTTELTNAAQSLIDTPLTGQVEEQISGSINDLLRALPSPGSCTPFSIPSPFGGQIPFSCEFSFQFKALFAFLMYIFTAWTLIDILLTGITPRIQTTQNHSDYVT